MSDRRPATSEKENPLSPFTAKTEISSKDIADLAVIAFEMNYLTGSWCGSVHPVMIPEGIAQPWYSDPKFWETDFQLTVKFDGPEDEEGSRASGAVIGRAEVQAGFELWASQQPSSFGDFLQQEADAETADVWWQLTVLKSVVYG